MKAVMLGTGGYHPNERRHTASIFFPEIGFAFDAGSSFFRIQPRLQTTHLDIFLTHAHLDHICGLTYILVPMLNGQLIRVTVHGRTQTLAAVKEHLFADPVFPLLPEFWFREIEVEDHFDIGLEGVLKWVPLEHPGGSVGYRIDWPDRSFAYITDTTTSDDYLEFISGVDVLIHECYFSDEMAEWAPKTGHSCTTPVANLAREANVGRLILTHIDPQHPEDDPIRLATAQSIFPNTILGEDLMEIEF